MSYHSFPQFRDGDVRITILPDVYCLHSQVIKGCSGLLKRHPHSSQEPQGLRSNQTSNYLRINLVASAFHKYGVFNIQENAGDQCDILEAEPSYTFPKWSQKTRQLWANMFRIFYKISPALEQGGSNMLLENCLGLVELAGEIQATKIVFQAIDSTLPILGQELYRNISNDPISWMNLAIKIHSSPTFNEALIHTVGQWNSFTEKAAGFLPAYVRQICIKKNQELIRSKRDIEMQLVNSKPCGPGNDDDDSESSELPNDIYFWMAISTWRRWLCHMISDDKTLRASDGGANFYRTIGAPDQAFEEIIRQESSDLPLSVDDEKWPDFKNRLMEVTQAAEGLVCDLISNKAKYDPKLLGELPYLTCCSVDDSDLPWRTPPRGDRSFTQGGNDISLAFNEHNECILENNNLCQLDTLFRGTQCSRTVIRARSATPTQSAANNNILGNPVARASIMQLNIPPGLSQEYLDWEMSKGAALPAASAMPQLTSGDISQPLLDQSPQSNCYEYLGLPPIIEDVEGDWQDNGHMAFL